jgi:hypothetical protein
MVVNDAALPPLLSVTNHAAERDVAGETVGCAPKGVIGSGFMSACDTKEKH